MKNLGKFSLVALASIVLYSCSSDDDSSTPEIINEEEVITTSIVTLVPEDGGEPITISTADVDGEGPIAPVNTVSGSLVAGTTYAGTIQFLNDLEEEVEDITIEIEEEDEDHQIFYVANEDLDLEVAYTETNVDEDGNPLGTEFVLTTGEASTGNFTVILRHEPTKPNEGLESAGGETEFEATYVVTIEEAIAEPVM